MWRRRRSEGPHAAPVDAGFDDVVALFEGVPWTRWAALDGDLRRRGGTDSLRPFLHWYGVGPADVALLADRSGRPAVVAAWLAMHTDGHVREAALDVLATVADPIALPTLVVRSVDWVDVVRRKAQADLARRPLREADAVRLLPLVASLARPGHRRAEVPAALLHRLGDLLSRGALLDALSGDDVPVRRVAATILVDRGDVADDVIARAVVSADIVVLRTVTRAALTTRADDVALLDRLAEAPVGDLRAVALHRVLAGGGAQSDAQARARLLDRASLVRDVAQRHLRRAGVDVVGIYEEALPRPRAIRGLAEVGDRSAAPLVVPLLADSRPAVRAAAARTWAVVGPDGGRPELLALLLDGSPQVVRAAGLGLGRSRLDDATLDRLSRRLVTTDHAGLRRATAAVVGRQDRWSRLLVGLRALTARPVARETGAELVRGVLQGWNDVATAPSVTHRDELAALVAHPDLAPPVAAEVRDILRRWT